MSLSAIFTVNHETAHYKRSALCSALLSAFLLGAPLILSSCGFHLRGYDTPMTYSTQNAALILNDNDPTSFRLKLPLKQRLNAVGVNVVDEIGKQINSSEQLYTSSIRVNNVQFKRYELVGVLTEIRLVLSADVVYETLDNSEGITGEPMAVRNTIQVERTYQFDEASVSIEDKQGQQVQDWLYQNLAQRITDQYVALNLPRKVTEDGETENPDVSVLLPSKTNETQSEPES